jgi:hypothetical protein
MLALLLLKLIAVAAGLRALQACYQSYERRRRDPTVPRDRVSDILWRTFVLSGAVLVSELVAALVINVITGTLPDWSAVPLFVLGGAATLGLFVSGFLIGIVKGWREAP